MNITGEYILNCTRTKAWEALNDPQVMGRCTPGCQSINVVKQDTFEMLIKIGIAAISGTYKGKMQLCNKEFPEKYSMVVEGAGPIGILNVTGDIYLKENSDSTSVISYSFDVQIGGVMTGLGQRALSPIAKILIKQFFGSIAKEITMVA